MKSLLVSVDFSSITGLVIKDAIALARGLGAKVNLLHVVQPPVLATTEYSLPVDVIQQALNVTDKAARHKLAEYAGEFSQAGIDCETAVLVGMPVAVILEQAGRTKAEYIVMGSHGHGKLYDFFVGSTASGVLKKARCGVIVLPSADKPQ